MKTVFERTIPAAGLVDRSLAATVLQPFWLDDLPAPPSYPALTRASSQYDLVVVGGGYTGLWSALRAKQRDPGMRVALVEGQTIGWAASGRNGGFVEASLTHGEENGRSRWPDEIDVLNRLGMENLDAIEKSVDSLGLDCDFERTGSMAVAVEPYQAAELAAAATEPGLVLLDQQAIRAEVDSPTYLAGVWSKDTSALVHPAKLAYELARAAVELGVEIYEHSKVLGLEQARRGGPVSVRTERASLQADRVILATNGFPSLLKRYRYHTVPVYDYALMTEPLTDAQLAEIGWHNRQGMSDMSNQFHYYRLSKDNRILWGGYDAIYHFGGRIRPQYEDRDVTYRRLAGHFFTTFPQLEDVRFTHRWAGMIDTSTRFCAFFGSACGGRVGYAAGFTGLGVAATRFAAEVMLDRFSGTPTARTELDMVKSRPLPFPPEPLASVGIQATRWSLDRADHREGRRNTLLKTLDSLGLGFDS
ncbi:MULTISPECIES: FAD-binding oxidoreductase [unclassified Mycolicibacterium]|uniref:NAD(P)/FAD-dependent oxidoreductase n=1 Tax=unclassified Mycolicibacterium TaxID=2636767 RepID=UPI00130D1ABB|nr:MULTISPECIES: FAD-dependent oxidoreductase [unclassified Mycolicibacterium]MUL81438.1 FAD-dependent oxidoreductase [Mycolicibacterium sp. CBMA 329]MUL87204.1 FAD-dependent oxidoreductase [Mycolicibacterium sp. CBMA 331]MUL98514.1 FAD-dependent oxidoreductase [Mycolicibacterium sp. CBMA 334]MUM25268.1 FAD-dependent oxidoreductase [Mycolicibacterium sp. CBMA 295]MUM37501.1 FAD-dependent oxidoreductase [Mycolicibacterium sp. CBMA 247]